MEPIMRQRSFRGKAAMFLGGGMVVLAGCATTQPVTPEVVCTSQWVNVRVDAAMDEFAQDTRKAVRILKKAAADYDQGEAIEGLRRLRVMSALNSLAKTFARSQARQDILYLAKTCENPMLVHEAMRSFLSQQGASESLIALLEVHDVYQAIMAGRPTENIQK